MHSTIRRKWAAGMLLWMLPLMLAGCLGGTRHVVHTPGARGVSLGGSKFTFPDKDGKLAVGTCDLPPGVLVQVPKTQAEVEEHLKAGGAQFVEPKKPDGK